MLDNYDKVYPERNIPPGHDPENFVIQQIRECVFEKFLPFLKPAYLVIDQNVEKPRKMQDYWNQNQYEQIIKDQCDPSQTAEYLNFAKRLCVSQSFADFIDGFLEEKLMNFDLVNSILCHLPSNNKYNLEKRYKVKSSTFSKFDDLVIFKFFFILDDKFKRLERCLHIISLQS